MVMRRSQEKSELKVEMKLSQRTLDVWQSRSRRDLNCEDARQITENMIGFFRILSEWEAKGRTPRERKSEKLS